MSDNSGLIVSALEKTDGDLYTSIDAASSWKNSIRYRGNRVNLFREYERGDHRADMMEEIRKLLRLPDDDTGITELNVNYCKIVVDKMAGRLHVSDIAVDEGAERWLKDTLLKNDFEAQQGEWYRAAIRDGDAYVMIDPETALWTSEPAYDGFSGIVVIFDDMTRKPIWACKLWSEADIQDVTEGTSSAAMKIVVYQQNKISYWNGQEGSNEVSKDSDDKSWPASVEGLPIIHFCNQKDNYTSYGESELRPVIPLQDSLNSIQHDKTMASKLSAFKIYWSIGMNIDKDGIVPGSVINLVPFDPAQGMTAEQAEYLKAIRTGSYDVTDMSQYTNMIDKEVQQISNVSATPIYGVTTQGNLSGEALKQLEIGLLGKVERFQRQNADAIKELISLTAAVQNAFEGSSAPEVGTVSVTWKSAELLDTNARITALITMRSSAPDLWSDEWYRSKIGSLLGMSNSEITEDAKIVEENQVDKGAFDFFETGVDENAV